MQTPSSDEFRRLLLNDIEEFCRLTGTARSALGKAANDDTAFVSRLISGKNVTYASHDKMVRYLRENWPGDAA